MKIELYDYNPDWAKLFDSERQLISTDFPVKDFSIEHVGSTAVPNLKAKAIIDIMLGVPTLPKDISPSVNYLKSLDYQYIDKYNLIIPERRYFIKNTNGIRTHHLHMVSFHSDFWDKHLFFRNQLRDNSVIRQQYQKLKTDLGEQEWNSSNDYADAKSDFIKSIDQLRQPRQKNNHQ